MATTHTYVQFGATDWSTPAKARNVWVYLAGGWTSASNMWAWDGTTWQRGFTTTPGPLVGIAIQYSSLSCSAFGTLNFSVIGYDADGLGIGLDGSATSWFVSIESDSISPTGDGTTATFSGGSGTWTDNVSVSSVWTDPYGGGTHTWGDNVNVTVG